MKIFGLAGWSGSGKTTLIVDLVRLIRERGLTVSTVKHTHHDFDMDRPGKDSYRHREAGAGEVMVVAGRRWALMHELRDEPEPGLDSLIAHMAPADLLLVEGFKTYPHEKIEIHRPALGKPMIWPDDPSIAAVASDTADLVLPLPLLDLGNPRAITDFILTRSGLRP